MDFDVIVLGGGPGGYSCAIRCAQYGLRAAVVEKDALGGTCLNRGCIPTKTVLHAASLLRQVADSAQFGLRITEAKPDLPALRARCTAVTETLREGVSSLLMQNGVSVICGVGFVSKPGEVRVTAADGAVTVFHAQDIVAAVGSVPAIPPISGVALPGVFSSDTLLSELPQMKKLIVIGGGVIGVEFAEAYAAFGTEVTILEAAPRILPPFDREPALQLAAQLKKHGVQIITEVTVNSIEDGLRCTYTAKDGTGNTVQTDGVLLAVGRRAATEGIFADSCMPKTERSRIVTDENCRTSIAGLYAIGDAAAGAPQLAHAAAAQGLAVAAVLAGRTEKTDGSLIPSCVYTLPELATVGPGEQELKARFGALQTAKFLMRGNGRSLIDGQEGFVKLLADGDGVLRGAQMLCEGATDMIGEAALAIRLEMTAEAFAAQVRAHPTREEALGEAAAALNGRSIHSAPPRKRE